ncbi:MAG TPA: hypothetical protein VH814_22425 [Steroidobacteraceae bacterium]|jgi:uncharacterized repeat protein (TIGR01451 family)
MNGKKTVVAALLLTLTAGAYAADKACVELKTSAETEREVVEQGQKVKRLMPAGKVLPGDEVVWTITATNVCKTPTDNVAIANPVPEHMTYVSGSAIGSGADVAYSLDGKEFKDAGDLAIRAADGTSRAARADEYRAIRWTYKSAFAPGATAFVRYRALVN